MIRALFVIAFFLAGFNAYSQDRIETSLIRSDGAKIPALLSSNWYQSECGPTLILSHGFGGTKDGLAYAASAAEKTGYRVINISHIESGPSAWERAFTPEGKSNILLDQTIWEARESDLIAAINFSKEDNCNPQPFILGGHSMGAALTMMEAGAVGNAPFRGENRFDGYIAISPQGTGWAFSTHNAWDDVNKPILMITGTEDSGYYSYYQTRLEAWEGLPSYKKRLVIISRATHFSLGGRGRPLTHKRAELAISEFLLQMQSSWDKSTLYNQRGIVVKEK